MPLLALAFAPKLAFAQSAPAGAAPGDPEAPSDPAAPSGPAAPLPPATLPDEPAPTPAPGPAPATDAAPAEEASPDAHKKKKKRARAAAEATPGEATDDEASRRGNDAADKPKQHEVRFKARVFALAEASHRRETVVGSAGTLETRNRDALDLSLQSARVGADYRSPLRWLSAEVEVELTNKPRVKDAYLEAGKGIFVKAGQFKVPAAVFELDSAWTLPTVHRGLVHDLMTDWLDIASRRPGLAVGYKSKDGLKPRLTLGAFQGTTLKQVAPGDRDVKLIDHATLRAQTYAARAEITVRSVSVGAWFEDRVGSTVVGEFSHFATFGLDAKLDQRFEGGALRAWVDGTGGKSLYVNAEKPGAAPHPWFAAGRALVGYRFGGTEQSDLYLEPFGFVAVMDPDTQVVADMTTEAAVGIAAGFWDRGRVTLQGEFSNTQRNSPEAFLDNQDPDHTSLFLQAGARF